jgi:hypothetical protein
VRPVELGASLGFLRVDVTRSGWAGRAGIADPITSQRQYHLPCGGDISEAGARAQRRLITPEKNPVSGLSVCLAGLKFQLAAGVEMGARRG